jgi:hypothetical protein
MVRRGKRCGKEAAPLQVDWGKHIDQKAIVAIGHGKFDTVTSSTTRLQPA